MKAITLYQPYASLIAETVKVIGTQEVKAKRFETRSWATAYRGPLAVHAGMKKPSDILTGGDIDVIFAMGRVLGVPEKRIDSIMEHLDALPRGVVVATTNLTGCEQMWNGASAGLRGAVCINRTNQYWSPNWMTITDEFLFGDWRPGRFAWELHDTKKLPEPIPVKGHQGLWEWDEEGLR